MNFHPDAGTGDWTPDLWITKPVLYLYNIALGDPRKLNLLDTLLQFTYTNSINPLELSIKGLTLNY